MDRSVEPLLPRARILPPKRSEGRKGSRRFVVDGEVRPPEPEEQDQPESSDELSLGHAAENEVGARLDVTA